MEMRGLRLKRSAVAATGLLTCGVLLWVMTGSHWSYVVLEGQCLGGDGEECAYYCEDTDCEEYVHRLKRYCHYSLLESVQGDEGSVSHDKLELVHVNMMVRHGDRTPATAYSIYPPPESYDCGVDQNDPKWLGLSDFHTLSLHTSVQNSKIPLLPDHTTKICEFGRLTQTGYKQENALGYFLRTKYAPMLSSIVPPEGLYVQSTDYKRTIHSAAAFLLGFLPNDAQIRKSTTIHVLPNVLADTPPNGIKRTYDYCNKYNDLWSNDLKFTNFKPRFEDQFQSLTDSFRDMFSIEHKASATRLVDHLQVRGCHFPSNPLPCNGQGDCVDYSFAKRITTAADWVWSQRYPTLSSFLGLLPFLKHSILDVMENVVKGEGPMYKVLLTFTHDDVITTMRTVLGLTTSEWMPYASRLVFELWRLEGSSPEYYVRILFNGQSVTDVINIQSSRIETDDQLIPYSSLRNYILTNRLADVHTYCEHCGCRPSEEP